MLLQTSMHTTHCNFFFFHFPLIQQINTTFSFENECERMMVPPISLFFLFLVSHSSGSVTQRDTGPIPQFNPVTTPSTSTPFPTVVTVPSANIPSTTPTINPPMITSSTWCIAKSGVAEAALQSALDYACGIGGSDCSSIQPGAACFYPDNLQTHASVAFNSYYQRNPLQTSCDFGGTALITNLNPSFGSCIFTTSMGTPAILPSPIPIPIPVNNPVPTPTTQTYSPPVVFNTGNPPPALDPSITGYGDGTPAGTSLPISASLRLNPPFAGFILFLLLLWL